MIEYQTVQNYFSDTKWTIHYRIYGTEIEQFYTCSIESGLVWNPTTRVQHHAAFYNLLWLLAPSIFHTIRWMLLTIRNYDTTIGMKLKSVS